MLIIGVVAAAVGALADLYALNEVTPTMTTWFSFGLLSLLFGGATILAAGVGYIIAGSRQFRLRTLLGITAAVATLLAFWTALAGPAFFDNTSIAWHDGSVWIELAPGEYTSPDGNSTFTYDFIQLPTVGLGLLILPLVVPFLFLPFALRGVSRSNPGLTLPQRH